MDDSAGSRVRVLLAALDSEAAPAHLASLCEELTAPGGALLLDELSFEIFGPVLASHSHPSCCEAAERVLLALAGAANAREIFCLVMEGFRIHEAPRSQLLMLRLLATLLPRIQRKRAEFYSSALSSLSARFLETWPASAWLDMEDAGDSSASDAEAAAAQLASGLLACVAPLAVPLEAGGSDGGIPSDAPDPKLRRLVLSFLWRTLEAAAVAGAEADEGSALELLCRCAPSLAEVEIHCEIEAEVEAAGSPAATGAANSGRVRGGRVAGGAAEQEAAAAAAEAEAEAEGRWMRPTAVMTGAALYLHALYRAAPPPAPSVIAAAPTPASARDQVDALNEQLQLARRANTANTTNTAKAAPAAATTAPAAATSDAATDVAVAPPVAALRGAAAAALLEELAHAPLPRRVALLCGLGSRLLRREATLAARGRELLGAAAPEAAGPAAVGAAAAAAVSGEAGSVGVLLGAGQRRQAAGCLPLLLNHMATSPEQKARS